MSPLALRLASLCLLFLPLSGGAQTAGIDGELDVLSVEASLSAPAWEPGQQGDLVLKLQLADGYHAYADMFRIQIEEPEDFGVGKLRIKPLKKWFDKPTKREREGIEKSGEIRVNVEAPRVFMKPAAGMRIFLTYQACSESVCLLPITKQLSLPITLVANDFEEAPSSLRKEQVTNGAVWSSRFLSQQRFEGLMKQSFFLTLFFVFLAGIITSFTPCIFPMIPITLAILGKEGESHNRIESFFLSIFYVFGIAITYASLGVLVSFSGGVFGASLGNPYLLSAICFVFLGVSLSMYGLFEIQLPGFIRKRFSRGGVRKGFVGAFFSGLLAGVVASPCVGPVLIGILTYVSTQKDPLVGFLLLFFYALGLGCIFIVLGLFNQLLKYLPRSGPWLLFSKFLLGTLMLTAFYYYLDLLVPARVFDFALGVGLVVLASVYGAFLNVETMSVAEKWRPYMRVRKGKMIVLLTVGVVLILIAVFDLRRPGILALAKAVSRGESSAMGEAGHELGMPALSWEPYNENEFQKALSGEVPVILDVRADWCGACLELEERTFLDPKSQELLRGFRRFKFDATNRTPDLDLLTKRYGIKGLPFVVFYNRKGELLSDLTLMEYESAPRFHLRLAAVSQK